MVGEPGGPSVEPSSPCLAKDFPQKPLAMAEDEELISGTARPTWKLRWGAICFACTLLGSMPLGLNFFGSCSHRCATLSGCWDSASGWVPAMGMSRRAVIASSCCPCNRGSDVSSSM